MPILFFPAVVSCLLQQHKVLNLQICADRYFCTCDFSHWEAVELPGQAIRMFMNACGIRPWIFLQGIPSQGPLMLISKDWRMRSGLHLPWQQIYCRQEITAHGIRMQQVFPQTSNSTQRELFCQSISWSAVIFQHSLCFFYDSSLAKNEKQKFPQQLCWPKKTLGTEKFFSINPLSFCGFIAPLLIPCLFRNLCLSINILAGRLDSKERLFRIDCFPVVIKKEKMDLAGLCSFF